MTRLITALVVYSYAGCVVLLCGCQQAKISAPAPKNDPAQSASSQPSKTQSTPRNERLKRAELDDSPVLGDNEYRGVTGIWIPESSDPAKALIFPEQVRITCINSEKTCRELTVTLGAMGGLVSIMGPDEKVWPIISWDARGLLASYGPNVSASAAASERCHSHVLTMTFSSGAVSTSDIPTHEKGCEEFAATDSYRLNQGSYYVDTSPENNMDKPDRVK